jgi:hypothetical protein
VCANKVNEQKDTRFFIIDSFERNVLYDGVLIKRKRNSIVKYGTQIVWMIKNEFELYSGRVSIANAIHDKIIKNIFE